MSKWTMIAVTLVAYAISVAADSTSARCDIYSSGSDQASKMIPCTFSQRQGGVTITREAGNAEFSSCPAGILRMEGGQASIVVQNRQGKQLTINFMRDYVNSTNRQIDAQLEGDTWMVTVENGEVYEVPLAAIEGG